MLARDDKWTWVGGERVEVVPDSRLTALVEAIEDLRADDPGQRLPAELGDDLVQLRHACDLLELEFAAQAAAFAATDEYEQQGYLNPHPLDAPRVPHEPPGRGQRCRRG